MTVNTVLHVNDVFAGMSDAAVARCCLDRAGLTTVPVVPWKAPPPPGGPDQLPIFCHAVLTFARVDVQCRLKERNDN